MSHCYNKQLKKNRNPSNFVSYRGNNHNFNNVDVNMNVSLDVNVNVNVDINYFDNTNNQRRKNNQSNKNNKNYIKNRQNNSISSNNSNNSKNNKSSIKYVNGNKNGNRNGNGNRNRNGNKNENRNGNGNGNRNGNGNGNRNKYENFYIKKEIVNEHIVFSNSVNNLNIRINKLTYSQINKCNKSFNFIFENLEKNVKYKKIHNFESIWYNLNKIIININNNSNIFNGKIKPLHKIYDYINDMKSQINY